MNLLEDFINGNTYCKIENTKDFFKMAEMLENIGIDISNCYYDESDIENNYVVKNKRLSRIYFFGAIPGINNFEEVFKEEY